MYKFLKLRFFFYKHENALFMPNLFPCSSIVAINILQYDIL